jgi:hypothetical protein
VRTVINSTFRKYSGIGVNADIFGKTHQVFACTFVLQELASYR